MEIWVMTIDQLSLGHILPRVLTLLGIVWCQPHHQYTSRHTLYLTILILS